MEFPPSRCAHACDAHGGGGDGGGGHDRGDDGHVHRDGDVLHCQCVSHCDLLCTSGVELLRGGHDGGARYHGDDGALFPLPLSESGVGLHGGDGDGGGHDVDDGDRVRRDEGACVRLLSPHCRLPYILSGRLHGGDHGRHDHDVRGDEVRSHGHAPNHRHGRALGCRGEKQERTLKEGAKNTYVSTPCLHSAVSVN